LRVMDIRLHKKHQEVQETHFWFRVKDNLLLDIAEKYFEPNGNVLDFGCNYGHSTKLLQSKGFDAYGVDVSTPAINYGHSIGIKNIFLEAEKTFDKNFFDAVIALDVIEHIEDDQKALEYLVDFTKPGGIIVLMVPAHMFLWGVQDIISHHFRRYSVESLKKLIKSNGKVKIVRKSYFNSFLFLPIALVRLFTRFFVRNPRESDLDMNNSVLNKILYFVFDLERRLLKYIQMPFGVSLLLVLRKN